jgi:succinate dehydrogenase / fumarate reductase flavoprotein subunit
MIGGPNMVKWAKGNAPGDGDDVCEREARRQGDAFSKIMRMDGRENAYALAREMGEVMTENVTVIRHNDKLAETDRKLLELKDRWGRIGLADRGRWANHEISFVKQLWNMLELARVIALGALRRDESRGAHYKPAFPERDDANWMKTTKARWTSDGPEFTYEPVDATLVKPRPRKYDIAKPAPAAPAAAAKAS